MQVGDFWLGNCHALMGVSFVGLGGLISVGNSWRVGCGRLSDITFSSPKDQEVSGTLAQLRSVGDDWLAGCTSITQLKLQRLSSLDTIGDRWLGGCPRIWQVVLSKDTKLGGDPVDLAKIRKLLPKEAKVKLV